MFRAPPHPGPSAPHTPPRPRGLWRWLRRAIIAGIWGILALVGALLWLARDLPQPDLARETARRPSLTLEDRTGRIYASYGDLAGETMRLADLPPALPEAVVAIEDRRFWHHPGFDPLGLVRAAWIDLRAGQVVQGGSTLTQQVAKNLFLTNARTSRRKAQEAMLTLWLERHFSKTEILEIWLNRVYLGSGAWGVDAAARLYFGVSARKLTLWQCAVLAGLPRAPSRFNPRADPAAAAARARVVLDAMVETGAISRAQADRAAAQIVFPPRPGGDSGWFADWVAGQAEDVLPAGADATLRTTLDPRLQTLVEARVEALLAGPGAAAGAGQAAVVALDAATGAVRAMAGGRDYRTSTFNRAVTARRQPGSTFKPFVWLAALERGLRPEDTVSDAPIRVGGWSPANLERESRGEITLEEALAQSVNTAAVRLLLRAGGPRAVAAVAHRLGIADALPDEASLALGTAEVGLLELTASYAPFFNGGDAVTPFGLETARSGGRLLASPRPAPVPAVAADRAAMMARMLAAVVRSGTGRAAAIPGRAVAGKTGTTQDFRDAWFVGHVSGMVIGIWVGNDDGTPMRPEGGRGGMGGGLPARLFREIGEAVR